MAYIFHENDLPRLISAVPGRERTFFVNKELTKIDDMLAGVMHYVKGASSPYHLIRIASIFISSWKDKAPSNRSKKRVTWDQATWCLFPPRRSIACEPPKHRCSILNFRRRIASSPRFWTEPPTTFAGTASRAASGFRPKSTVGPKENSC